MSAVHLQPRDLHGWMPELAEVGILDLPTIAERHFPGIRRCQQRLKLAVHPGLVDRLVLTVTSDDGRRGRLHHLFRLSRRGAEVLEHERGITFPRPPKRSPRPEMLRHRVGVAKIQLIVNDSCALHGIPRPFWIGEHTTYPDLAARMKKAKDQRKPLPATDRFIILERYPLPDGRTVTCWPDASCLLSIPMPDGTTHPMIVDWEFDRSTMQLSDIAHKMIGFQMKFTSGSYAKHWPQALNPTIRIFFVVPSPARLLNIAGAIKDSPVAKLVRLTTTDDLSPLSLFQPIWRTVDGDSRPLVDHSLPGSPLRLFIEQTAEQTAVIYPASDQPNARIPHDVTKYLMNEAQPIIKSFCVTQDAVELVTKITGRCLHKLVARAQAKAKKTKKNSSV